MAEEWDYNFDDDVPEGAQYIERPDGSVVVKPYSKKVKTGTWVFYPNRKSKGRSYKPYEKQKKLGGEPDPEYMERRRPEPIGMEQEPDTPEVNVMPMPSFQYGSQDQQSQPQPTQRPRSIFEEVLNPDLGSRRRRLF